MSSVDLVAAARRRPRVADSLIAALVAGACALILSGRTGATVTPASPFDWAWVVVVAAPLIWRRRAPVIVFWTVVLLYWFSLAAGAQSPAGVLVPLTALHAVARYRSPVWAVPAICFVIPPGFAAHLDGTKSWAALFTLVAISVSILAIGMSQRTRQAYLAALEDRAERLERDRDQRARLAVADERARIAREMHDVVAHHLTVMTALSEGAAATVPGDPSRAATVMTLAAATGREALAEMRRLVGVLRSPADPLPALPPAPTDFPASETAPTSLPAPETAPTGPPAPETAPTGPPAPTSASTGPPAPETAPTGPPAPETAPTGPPAPTSASTDSPASETAPETAPTDPPAPAPAPAPAPTPTPTPTPTDSPAPTPTDSPAPAPMPAGPRPLTAPVPHHAPQPGLDDLDALVDRVRAAGLRVTVTHQGAPGAWGPGAGLAVYRIVQEALTNTLKHAGPLAHAEVRLRFAPDRAELDIVDDGAGQVAGATAGAGQVAGAAASAGQAIGAAASTRQATEATASARHATEATASAGQADGARQATGATASARHAAGARQATGAAASARQATGATASARHAAGAAAHAEQAAGAAGGAGRHGLIGMAERTAAYAGEFAAEPLAGRSGWRVHAVLRFDGPPSAAPSPADANGSRR
ncbi:histidine kinase [Actinoplanes sp. NPDC051343]|uniref:histidine kinase n=1 Tax=Actinoplanes sp. NPDC051343 TaxID=3363906 RepID=UPI0037B26EDD